MAEMKKAVLKVDLRDVKVKHKAMKMVSGIIGVESVACDMKDKKLTVIGDMDPVIIVCKLRKVCHTEIVSVGPAKEPEKKKEEPKKEEPKKEEPKKEEPKKEPKKEEPKKEEPKKEPKKEEPKKEEPKKEEPLDMVRAYHGYNYNPHFTQHYYVRSVENDPSPCVIS